jgi:hypothetical protein
MYPFLSYLLLHSAVRLYTSAAPLHEYICLLGHLYIQHLVLPVRLPALHVITMSSKCPPTPPPSTPLPYMCPHHPSLLLPVMSNPLTFLSSSLLNMFTQMVCTYATSPKLSSPQVLHAEPAGHIPAMFIVLFFFVRTDRKREGWCRYSRDHAMYYWEGERLAPTRTADTASFFSREELIRQVGLRGHQRQEL